MIPSIWTSIRHDLPLHEALAALQHAGWDAVEVSTEHLEQIEAAADAAAATEAARTAAARLNVRMLQAHAWLLADTAHPDSDRRERDRRRLERHLHIAA